MLALLDGDIIAFRCAASAEDAPVGIATWRTNELVETILREVGAQEYAVFLTGNTNFRYQIFPEYKANRLDKPRPQHLQACKDHLVEYWQAEVVGGMEADDRLGIEQVKAGRNGIDSVICSIDKDLLTIPGLHYNFVKKEQNIVSPNDAIRNFYYQLLVGDSSDGIKGAKGIGPKKAGSILRECRSELEHYLACVDHFSHPDELMMNAKLIYIWKEENDEWNPPVAVSEGEHCD